MHGFHMYISIYIAEDDDQQDADETLGGDGSGDSDENLAKIAANQGKVRGARRVCRKYFD